MQLRSARVPLLGSESFRFLNGCHRRETHVKSDHQTRVYPHFWDALKAQDQGHWCDFGVFLGWDSVFPLGFPTQKRGLSQPDCQTLDPDGR